MKKISAVLLITVLASGLVFAGLSGNANVSLGYNLDTKDYGFANGNNVTFDLDYVTELGAAKGEGSVYAEINATLGLKAFNGEKGGDFPSNGIYAKAGENTYVMAKIDSAKLYGDNWSVDITGVPGVADFAKSPIDTSTVKYEDDDFGLDKKDYTDNETWKTGYQKAPGVAVTLFGYTLGIGGKHVEKTTVNTTDPTKTVNAGTDISVYLGTPDIAIADGMTLKAAASFYQNHTNNITKATKAQKGEDPFKEWGTKRGRAVGGSLSFAYENDTFKASIATDLGYELEKYEANATTSTQVADFKGQFNMDALASFAMDPVAVDVYFNTSKAAEATLTAPEKKMLLSAQVVGDLNSFNVPVKLTVTGKDLLQNMDFGLKAEVTAMEGLTITAKGGYVLNCAARDILVIPADFNVGKWSAGLEAKYEMDIMTVEAGFGVGNSGAKNALHAVTDPDHDQNQYVNTKLTPEERAKALILSAKASVASTTLIPGAELKLAWSADDLTKVYKIVADANGDKNNNLGKVELTCKIAF